MRRGLRKIALFGAVFASLAATPAAQAQNSLAGKVQARLAAAAQKIEAACSADVKTYCSSITPGDGRLVYCIMAYQDKISAKCDYALYEAGRNMERALDRIEATADACWNDIVKYCVNVPEGGGRIASCLAARKDSLSKTCKAAIGKFSAAN